MERIVRIMNDRFLAVVALLLGAGALAYVAWDKFSPRRATETPVIHTPDYNGGSVGDPYSTYYDLDAFRRAGSFVVAAKRGRVEEVANACRKAGFLTSVIWKVELVECRWTAELTQAKLEEIARNDSVEFIEPNQGMNSVSKDQKTPKSNDKSGCASLDRIDSQKGYSENNVQWAHKVVNKMNMNVSQKEFIGWCSKIKDKNA